MKCINNNHKWYNHYNLVIHLIDIFGYAISAIY